jgi:hypothetical protein
LVGFVRPIKDEINIGVAYEINYRRTVPARFDSDVMLVTFEGQEFTCGRTSFIEDEKFLGSLRWNLKQLCPDAWVKVFPARGHLGSFNLVFTRNSRLDN